MRAHIVSPRLSCIQRYYLAWQVYCVARERGACGESYERLRALRAELWADAVRVWGSPLAAARAFRKYTFNDVSTEGSK
jgi:hypothetical protein